MGLVQISRPGAGPDDEATKRIYEDTVRECLVVEEITLQSCPEGCHKRARREIPLTILLFPAWLLKAKLISPEDVCALCDADYCNHNQNISPLSRHWRIRKIAALLFLFPSAAGKLLLSANNNKPVP